MANSCLHSALRETSIIGDRLVAHLDLPATDKSQPAPEIDIDNEGRWLLVVTNQIWHQTFQNIRIETQRFHTVVVTTIAINVFVDEGSGAF